MDKINNEIWRPCVGYECLYAVSDKGRVKSLNYRHTGKEQVMKPTKNKDGYLNVDLFKNGKVKKRKVHRLVAEAFIPNPNPEKYSIINHKIEGDEGKLINTVENLEWCDNAYNTNYGTARERRVKAMTNGKLSKTVYQYTTARELVKEWESLSEVYRQTGWYQQNISACCLGKKKTAYNYVWSYTRFCD